MGFFDAILGRTTPKRPALDALFALPGAAISLQVGGDFTATGVGSICFKAPSGPAFADVERDVRALLDVDSGPDVETTVDAFGYTWFTVRSDPPDITSTVTDIHAVTTSLIEAGFGPSVLCALINFSDAAQRHFAMVYVSKRGTFYPFAPKAGVQERDTMLELRVRDLIKDEMPVETDTSLWFALWDAPGL